MNNIKRSQLMGGMQERLHRQEIISYVKKVEDKKNKLKLKEKNKNNFGISSFHDIEDFDEPVFRRIRSKRGFFWHE